MKSKAFEIPFAISPSTSLLTLHFNEVRGPDNPTYVEFEAWFPADGHHERMQAQFDFPFEARTTSVNKIGATTLSLGTVIDSMWVHELFSDSSQADATRKKLRDLKHFFFIGHDIAIEVAAYGCAFSSLGRIPES